MPLGKMYKYTPKKKTTTVAVVPVKRRRPRVKKKYNSYYKNGALTIPRTLKAEYNTIIWEDSEYNLLPSNGTTSETFVGKIFMFSECHLSTNYSAIFDQYRINQVEIIIQPIMTQVVQRPYDDTTTANLVNAIPRYSVVIDVDNIGVTTFESMESASNSLTRLATKGCRLKFCPRVLMTNADGAKISNKEKPIIDMATPSVKYYGLKFALEPASPANAYSFRIQTKYYMSFFNKRR